MRFTTFLPPAFVSLTQFVCTEARLLEEFAGATPSAEEHHFDALFLYAEDFRHFAVAQLFHVREPERGAVYRAQLFKDGVHVHGEGRFLRDSLRKALALPIIALDFLPPPAIAQDVRCG